MCNATKECGLSDKMTQEVCKIEVRMLGLEFFTIQMSGVINSSLSRKVIKNTITTCTFKSYQYSTMITTLTFSR